MKNKVAVITGGGGAIGGAIASGLSRAGARVALWDLSSNAAGNQARALCESGGEAVGIACNVTSRAAIQQALQETEQKWGPVDILINAAGGSSKKVTTATDLRFFNIPDDGLVDTFALNYLGTVLPCQVVGRGFAERGCGVILNIASIAGLKPLTRAIGYSNAKAAVVNFTEWLAVHMAKEYNPAIRVNALAPGFVLTEQNRFLLQDEKTGEPTERGKTILSQVPMGRYGLPEEMVGAALWLVSDTASFVTGTIVTVDGGLSAYGGV